MNSYSKNHKAYHMKTNALSLIFVIFLSSFLFCSQTVKAQQDILPVVNWLTFDQVKELNKERPKPILVYFYNPTHDSSQLMFTTTFARKDICGYMNNKYYAVKFDLTSKEEINFLDNKVYKKDPSKPQHDLTTLLLGNKPIEPTILVYNDLAAGFSFNGYKNNFDMLCILVYFGENIEKTTKYDVWAPAYFRTFPPDKQVNRIPLAIHWMTLEEALKANQENPKGIFLTWFTKWNAASSVMLVNAFTHKKVSEFMNENFYNVRLDAQTTDTLRWDKDYYNKDDKGHFHEMAINMMKGKMTFPSIFFFDKSNKLILSESLYLSPEALFLLSNYVKSEAYKNTKFADYMKSFKFDWEDIAPTEHINK